MQGLIARRDLSYRMINEPPQPDNRILCSKRLHFFQAGRRKAQGKRQKEDVLADMRDRIPFFTNCFLPNIILFHATELAPLRLLQRDSQPCIHASKSSAGIGLAIKYPCPRSQLVLRKNSQSLRSSTPSATVFMPS